MCVCALMTPAADSDTLKSIEQPLQFWDMNIIFFHEIVTHTIWLEIAFFFYTSIGLEVAHGRFFLLFYLHNMGVS